MNKENVRIHHFTSANGSHALKSDAKYADKGTLIFDSCRNILIEESYFCLK